MCATCDDFEDKISSARAEGNREKERVMRVLYNSHIEQAHARHKGKPEPERIVIGNQVWTVAE